MPDPCRIVSGCAVLLMAGGLGAAAQTTPERTPDQAPPPVEAVEDQLSRLSAAVPGRSADSCQAKQQTLADQIIALEAQLMVTSLACDGIYGDPDLHNRYRRFVVAQQDVIREAQDEISRRLGAPAGDTRPLDDYRTALANAEAAVLQELAVGRYCALRRARFNTLVDADPDFFRAYADTVLARRQIGC